MLFSDYLGMNEYSDDFVSESSIIEEMRAMPIIPCEDDALDGCMKVAYESTVNFNKILEAMAKDELAYVQENGVEMVYEAGKVAQYWEKVQAWINNVWQKVVGVIQKAIDTISTLPAYAWYKANKKKIQKLPATFKFEKEDDMPEVWFYNTDLTPMEEGLAKYADAYVNSKIGMPISKMMDMDAVRNLVSSNPDKVKAAQDVEKKEFKVGYFNEVLDRGLKANNNANGGTMKLATARNFNKAFGNHIDISDFDGFAKESIKIFRIGDQKYKAEDVDVKAASKIITTAADAKQKVRKVYAATEKQFAEWKKQIKQAKAKSEKQHAFKKKSEDYSLCLKVMNYGVSCIRMCTSVNQALLRAHLSAIMGETYTNRSLLAAAISQYDFPDNDDKETKSTTESFLASLEF